MNGVLVAAPGWTLGLSYNLQVILLGVSALGLATGVLGSFLLFRRRAPEPRLGCRDELGHPAQVVGSVDEVDLAEPTQQGVAFLLGHAAGDTEDPPGACFLPSAQQTQIGVEAMLRLLANRTRVHDQHVGVVGVVGGALARVGEQVRHLLRVVDVHLAPVGAEVEAARRGHGVWGRWRPPQAIRSPSRRLSEGLAHSSNPVCKFAPRHPISLTFLDFLKASLEASVPVEK